MSGAVSRFIFFVGGKLVSGPVQGAGGFVNTTARMEQAKHVAKLGRPHGLYEPRPGYVAVFPDYSTAGNGDPVEVPLSSFVKRGSDTRAA